MKLCSKKNFEGFPYISLCKMSDPLGGAIFDPGGIIRTILVKVHLTKLHAKYRMPRPSGFRPEDF